MAKVMISLPDGLLKRLDAYARGQGATRSGLLQTLAERELQLRDDARRDAVTRLLRRPGRHGGRNAEHVAEARRSR